MMSDGATTSSRAEPAVGISQARVIEGREEVWCSVEIGTSQRPDCALIERMCGAGQKTPRTHLVIDYGRSVFPVETSSLRVILRDSRLHCRHAGLSRG
jgi:hypothetical protein